MISQHCSLLPPQRARRKSIAEARIETTNAQGIMVNNRKEEQPSLLEEASAKVQRNNHARNKYILNLMGVPYAGRPDVSTSYVPPTLFQFAHEILFVTPTKDCGDRHTLYLGPKMAASERARDALLQAQIVGIVNCTTRVPCCHRQHFRYCQVPVQDTPAADIFIYLGGATTFLDAMLQTGSVLVHCEQGMSRSAAVVMAYLMRFHGMTRDEAYVVCKTKRAMVNPNEGFWKQLGDYEKTLKKEHSTSSSRSDAIATMDNTSMKEWARRSQALFATCREIPQVLRTQDCWRLLDYGSVPEGGNVDNDNDNSYSFNHKAMTKLLTIGLDFCWGRGVRDEDIDWLLFVCDQFSLNDGMTMMIQPRAIVRDIVTDADSEFSEAWSGEIDLKDKSRILDTFV